MSEVNKLLEGFQIPRVIKVKQTFNNDTLDDVGGEILRQLAAKNITIAPGSRIALTAGSRGIDRYAEVMKTLADFVKSQGASPFIVPSMGSHGGATAEGQAEVLRRYGITGETVGAPVLSSMETVKIGETPRGLGVFIDKNACEADGIILINRVKPHTSFRGKYESGLVKMLAIGLAKQHGAEATHFLRYENMADNIVAVGKVALSKLKILCGVCTIENGYNHVAEAHVLARDEILDKEPGLLERAWARMPRIGLDEIDVLVVGEIGKEISGTGMDTNIVGRFHTRAASGGPATIKLGVLDVTDKSEGNANGMGLADFMPRSMYNKIDFDATYVNTLTSTEPSSSRMPMVLDDDRRVFQACVKLCGQVNPDDIRMVIIRSTKFLDEVYMSRAAVEAAQRLGAVPVQTVGDYQELKFVGGKLQLF
ncbi:MAG: lactate racemase domain-containing protein [Spirochaetaceae bacterium]|jgi:uncharacterized protein (DUF362 family)|nr:lactate racemase domain-containing protein [Spirochaetaceae bacterium]